MSPHGRRTLGLVVASFLVLTGCRSFRPVGPARARELLGELAEAAPTSTRVRRGVDLESRAISGRFEAVLISVSGAAPAGRLQLLPQVGPKLLDLAFHEGRVAGYFPAAGVTLSMVRQEGNVLPRHPLSFIVASLIEDLTPISSDRVLGERRASEVTPGETTIEVLLDSAVEGCTVSVLLDEARTIVGRDYELRGVRWTERRQSGITRFVGRGFSWTMGEAAIEEIPEPSALLFELDVPDSDRDRRPDPGRAGEQP